MKFVGVLERRLHGDPLCLPLKIDDVVQDFGIFIDVLDESPDALLLVVDHLLRLLAPAVLIDNRQRRI